MKIFSKIINTILMMVLLYYEAIIFYSTIKCGFYFFILGEILLFLSIFIFILSPYLKIKNNDKKYIENILKNKQKENKEHNEYGYIDYWDK